MVYTLLLLYESAHAAKRALPNLPTYIPPLCAPRGLWQRKSTVIYTYLTHLFAHCSIDHGSASLLTCPTPLIYDPFPAHSIAIALLRTAGLQL